jgi:membrane glycosyltransferase
MSSPSNPNPNPVSGSPRLVVSPATHENRAWRVFAFFSVAVLLTGVVSVIFADLLWRTGWSPSRTVLLVLFIILFFLAAIGCTHGIFGFFPAALRGEVVHHAPEGLSRPGHFGNEHRLGLPDLQRKRGARVGRVARHV